MSTTTQVKVFTAQLAAPNSATQLQLHAIMTSSPSTGRNTSRTSTDTISCKACSQALAVISPEGDLIATEEHDGACDSCQQMQTLCNDLQTKDAAFREVEHRREEYGPRVIALQELRVARMTFANFIESVQGDAEDQANEVHTEEQTDKQIQSPAKTSTAQPRGQKRSLSSFSSEQKPSKRPRLTDHMRRVSFDNSVVFRDAEAKRFDSQFSRVSDAYVPGRIAAPDGSEWWDTSGHNMSAPKFLGVKKQGSKWVPTKEGLQMDEEWADKDAAGTHGEGNSEGEDEMKGGDEGVHESKYEGEGDVPEARAEKEVEMAPADANVLPVNDAELDRNDRYSNPAPRTALSDPEDVSAKNREPNASDQQSLPDPQIRDHVERNGSPGAKDSATGAVETPQKAESGVLTQGEHRQEDEENWTLGFGWISKGSPNSRPRGEVWKEGADSDDDEQNVRGRSLLR